MDDAKFLPTSVIQYLQSFLNSLILFVAIGIFRQFFIIIIIFFIDGYWFIKAEMIFSGFAPPPRNWVLCP